MMFIIKDGGGERNKMNLDLLKDGCFIMIIGMGVVYFFIFIMVWIMNLSGKFVQFINKYFPEEIEENTAPTKKKRAVCDAEIALAIACAALKRGGKAC